VSDNLPKELCAVCKVEEMTGGVFFARLRTEKDRDRVSEGPACCDGCANLILNLLRQPNLLTKLKGLTQ
jgi:hypothetical protein